MNRLILPCILFLTALQAGAQDSLLMDLDVPKTQKEFVTATFKGTRLINSATLEVAGKRTLDFRISHRFSEFNTGINNFYGLDGPASIRLSFDYSYDGRLQLGIGRNSVQKLYEGSVKYRILRQTMDNKMPLSVTILGIGNITGEKDPLKAITGVDRYQYFSSRCSYVSQLIIGRKFNKDLSLQVSPTYIHYNLVQKITDKNDIFAVGVAGRYKVTRRIAITGEYIARLNKYTLTSDKDYVNSASVGIDIETGGHVFQLFVTNSFAINEAQFIPYTTTKWKDGGIRLGFNVSRVFTL